eukprot:394824_1
MDFIAINYLIPALNNSFINNNLELWSLDISQSIKSQCNNQNTCNLSLLIEIENNCPISIVAVLNKWVKELNTGNVWALEMQSGLNSNDLRLKSENSHDIILNYGGHRVLSRECIQHKNVLDLSNKLIDDISPSFVIHSICALQLVI